MQKVAFCHQYYCFTEIMMKFKKICAVALLIFAAMITVSCDSNSQSSITLFSRGKTNYTVVCASNASETVSAAAVSIARAAAITANAEIRVDVDSVPSGEHAGLEIIVGETNRPVSVETPENPNDFIIAVDGDSLVLLGGSDKATADAVEYFCTELIAEKTVIERNYTYEYTHKRTRIITDNGAIEAYTVTGDVDSEVIDDIASALFEKTGTKASDTPSDSAVRITVSLDESVNSNTVRFSAIDTGISIAVPSKLAISQIADTIRNEFEKLDTIELSSDNYVDFNYPPVTLSDIPSDVEVYFVGETDKNPLEYEVGEEITFTVTLKADGETVSAPLFVYEIRQDGKGLIKRDHVNAQSGSTVIKTTLETPGFVRLYVAVTSASGTELKGVSPFNGGAGASVSQIAQSVSEPEDFDEFWQVELAKLDEVRPAVTIVKDLSDDYPGFSVWDVRIDCVGDPVSGYVSFPKDADPESLPILVGFTGYGVVPMTPAVSSKYIVFSVNAHSIDNDREPEYYTSLSRGELISYGFNYKENLDRDKVYFKNMILRDVQAVRYLKTLPVWDGKNISLNGGSQGGFQATAVAALDPDVSYLYTAYTWMCDIGGAGAGRLPGWQPDYTDALRYYDTINFARRVKCLASIDAGLGDDVSTPTGIMSMFNAMTCPKTLNFTQNMTHYYTPPTSDVFTLRG